MAKIIDYQDSSLLKDCVLCYACEEYCKRGNHPMFLISERLEEKNMTAVPVTFTQALIDSYDPLAEDLSIRNIDEPVIDMCWDPQLAYFLVQGRLFEGVSTLPGDMGSKRHFGCQAIYLHTGSPSLTKKFLPKIVDNIARHNIKEIICAHDECYGMFTSYASAIGLEVPFKPLHLFEFLYNKLEELKASIEPLNIKAVYQRPCSSRLSPDKYLFVDKIFDLIGVHRVQRKYSGEKALCCGAAIMHQAREGRQELAARIKNMNLEDMAASGADVCVFNCPHCFETLAEEVEKRGIKPVFMSDLCRLAIGEKPRDYGVHLPLEMRGTIKLKK
ncbi:MAG: (Fe-S)-binding protein [Deltaproteobacteria bacterium]|nr:(Fe-S)-binding protein [Deltaproteobacteria bacterium]